MVLSLCGKEYNKCEREESPPQRGVGGITKGQAATCVLSDGKRASVSRLCFCLAFRPYLYLCLDFSPLLPGAVYPCGGWEIECQIANDRPHGLELLAKNLSPRRFNP